MLFGAVLCSYRMNADENWRCEAVIAVVPVVFLGKKAYVFCNVVGP